MWILQKKTKAITAEGGRVGRANANGVGPRHLYPQKLRRLPLEVAHNRLGTIPGRSILPIILWTIVHRILRELSLRGSMKNPRGVDPPFCLMQIAVELGLIDLWRHLHDPCPRFRVTLMVALEAMSNPNRGHLPFPLHRREIHLCLLALLRLLLDSTRHRYHRYRRHP